MTTSKKIRRIHLIVSVTSLVVILALLVFYSVTIYVINSSYDQTYNVEAHVALRKFPFPYKAAMTICSDIDNTTTLNEFWEIQRFLNTSQITSMGKGVGLEIGNSFLMYAPSTCSISYFSGNPDVSKTIIRFVKSGYIDFLHSYGEKPDFTRENALKALTELNRNSCKVDVWVDHTKSIDNFGDDVTFGLGDHPESRAYHADLTLTYGIKFVWLGRVTMITGQSTPVTMGTFLSIYDADHPLDSLVNITKELAKNVLAVFGNKKYAMHEKNDILKIVTLDNGQKVYEFTRFDNYWQGVATGANCNGLAYVISKKTLDRLKKVGGYMIVYTHLGKNSDCSSFIPKETQDALRYLGHEYKAGNIYVTTTSKLLNYYINHKYLNWYYDTNDNQTIIHIDNVKDPIRGAFVPSIQDLQGISFYVADRRKTRVFITENEIEHIQRNCADHTGRESVTIPLIFLKYPL